MHVRISPPLRNFLLLTLYIGRFSSVNEVICHGIPDQRKLQEGDIVNIGSCLVQRSSLGIAHCICYSQMYLAIMTVCVKRDSFSPTLTTSLRFPR